MFGVVDWRALEMNQRRRQYPRTLFRAKSLGPAFPTKKYWGGPTYTRGMAELDSKQGFGLTVHYSFSSSTWTEKVIVNVVLKDDQNTEGRKEGKGIARQANNTDKGQVGVKVHGMWRDHTFFLLLKPAVLTGCFKMGVVSRWDQMGRRDGLCSGVLTFLDRLWGNTRFKPIFILWVFAGRSLG